MPSSGTVMSTGAPATVLASRFCGLGAALEASSRSRTSMSSRPVAVWPSVSVAV